MILHQIESVFVEEFGFSGVGQFTKTFTTSISFYAYILYIYMNELHRFHFMRK